MHRYVVPAALLGMALVLMTLFAGLGFWQLERAESKRVLLAGYEAARHASGPEVRQAQGLQRLMAEQPFARLTLVGRYGTRHVLLDNQLSQGRPGWHVLTPFHLADGQVVMVNRGWIPLPAGRRTIPSLPAPPPVDQVKGIATRLARPGLRVAQQRAQGWPRVMQYPSAGDLSAALGAEVLPWQVLLDPDAPGGFVRAWAPQVMPPARHLGYAVQWFALAATVLIVALVLWWRWRHESTSE